MKKQFYCVEMTTQVVDCDQCYSYYTRSFHGFGNPYKHLKWYARKFDILATDSYDPDISRCDDIYFTVKFGKVAQRENDNFC